MVPADAPTASIGSIDSILALIPSPPLLISAAACPNAPSSEGLGSRVLRVFHSSPTPLDLPRAPPAWPSPSSPSPAFPSPACTADLAASCLATSLSSFSFSSSFEFASRSSSRLT